MAGKKERFKLSIEALEKLRKETLRRLMPQISVQSVAIAGTAVLSLVLMTWIVQGVAKVQDTYLAALYEALGTLVLVALVMIPLYFHMYKKRIQEITTLSDAIARVAGGDFHYQIPIRADEPMGPVYENFNRMTAELAGVQLLRNDFINSYSHEFKTPIASINGFASLLLERQLPEAEQRQYL